jgi:hypothetical protein
LKANGSGSFQRCLELKKLELKKSETVASVKFHRPRAVFAFAFFIALGHGSSMSTVRV